MHRQHVRRMPIIDATGKAVGIVTLDDLLVLLGDEMSDMTKTITEAFLRQPLATEEACHWWASRA